MIYAQDIGISAVLCLLPADFFFVQSIEDRC